VDQKVLRVLTMIEDKLARHYQADALPAGHPVREAIDELRRLRADAARYRWLADRMVHVGHPAGSGWTLDEVLVSGDRDLDEVIDALAQEQICGFAKNGQIPGAK
jgi:hypothetical protein